MSVWTGFLVFLSLSSQVKLSICLCLYQLFFMLFPSCFLAPTHSLSFFHAGPLDELSFLPSLPFFLLPPFVFVLSLYFVVPIPLFCLCWLPCLSFSTPFSALLSPFATHSYFHTISISFFVAQMSQYCIFSSPFFFGVTSFSVLLSILFFFFLQVSVRRGFTFSQDRQPVERGLLADQRLRL